MALAPSNNSADDPRASLRELCLTAARQIAAECDEAVAAAASSATVSGAKGAGEDKGQTAGSRYDPGHSHNRTYSEEDEGEEDEGEEDGEDGASETRPREEGSSLQGCGTPLIQLLGRQAAQLVALLGEANEEKTSDDEKEKKKEQEGPARHKAVNKDLLRRRLDTLAGLAYSRFYAYVFAELPACWRVLYTDAGILTFGLAFLTSSLSSLGSAAASNSGRGHDAHKDEEDDEDAESEKEGEKELDALIRPLDMALILAGGAGPRTRGRLWIAAALELLGEAWDQRPRRSGGVAAEKDSRPSKRPRLHSQDAKPHLEESWEDYPPFSTAEPFTPPVRHPIRRVSASRMPMEAFQAYLDRSSSTPHSPGPEPLVITGLTDAWPARGARPWARPAYLLSRTFGGRRLVPVEVGRSYVDAGWGQRIVPFGAFLREFIDPSSSSSSSVETEMELENRGEAEVEPKPTPEKKRKQTVYLAQHPLFTQLPSLRADITVPDLCYTVPPPLPPLSSPSSSPPPPPLDSPLLNAWLGPAGTITPLHTDPYHNLLAQVVGRKYVRLYSPREGPRMAARGREAGVEMGNTSRVDVGVVEGWDSPPTSESESEGEGEGEQGETASYERSEETKHERSEESEFKDVPYVDCILEPGDTLYIPVGWWHYVRGLSVSFSVSFWWN